MKKLLTLAVFGSLVISVNALTLTSPFYMQSEGKILSETELNYFNLRHGNTAYDLNERVSYGLADNIQLGADIGYLLDHFAGENESAFYNPTIFGYYRFNIEGFNLDAGAEVTLGLFEKERIGVDKDYAYNFVVRGSKDIDQFAFGGSVDFNINDYKNQDNDNDLGLYVYGLYNFDEKLAAGVDFAYTFAALGKDWDSKEYIIAAIGGYEFADNVGLFGRIGYVDTDEANIDASYLAGVQLRVLF